MSDYTLYYMRGWFGTNTEPNIGARHKLCSGIGDRGAWALRRLQREGVFISQLLMLSTDSTTVITSGASGVSQREADQELFRVVQDKLRGT